MYLWLLPDRIGWSRLVAWHGSGHGSHSAETWISASAVPLDTNCACTPDCWPAGIHIANGGGVLQQVPPPIQLNARLASLSPGSIILPDSTSTHTHREGEWKAEEDVESLRLDQKRKWKWGPRISGPAAGEAIWGMERACVDLWGSGGGRRKRTELSAFPTIGRTRTSRCGRRFCLKSWLTCAARTRPPAIETRRGRWLRI
jgi:hypothetical protein